MKSEVASCRDVGEPRKAILTHCRWMFQGTTSTFVLFKW